MAGDWIKMRADLLTHPKVFALAESFGRDEFWVAGVLFAFWAWADKYCVDGRVDGATSRVVDKATQVDGLADALVNIGWLEVDDDGITLPGFNDHNGESAKERSLKNQRQARWRERKAAGLVDGEASTDASTREEKRREEQKKADAAASALVDPLKPKTGPVTIDTWIDSLDGVDPIPEGDPVFAYADTVGIPQDLLTLSWLCFVRAHRESGKRQKDWRATYRNAVRGNWYKVWYLNPATGECTLTSNGAQAQAEFA